MIVSWFREVTKITEFSFALSLLQVILIENQVCLYIFLFYEVVLKVLIHLEEVLASVRLLEHSFRLGVQGTRLDVFDSDLILQVAPIGLGNDRTWLLRHSYLCAVLEVTVLDSCWDVELGVYQRDVWDVNGMFLLNSLDSSYHLFVTHLLKLHVDAFDENLISLP